MDTQLPSQPPVPQEGSKIASLFSQKLIILGALVLVFIAVTIILTRLVLKPPKKVEIVFAPPVIPRQNFDQKLQAGPFTCPTAAKSCATDGKYTGPLFAAFDGQATSIPSISPKADGSKEEFILVLLINKERGLQALYYFKGEGNSNGQVKEGEAIGEVSGQPLLFMDNNSFVFKLMRVTANGEETAKLSKKDFK